MTPLLVAWYWLCEVTGSRWRRRLMTRSPKKTAKAETKAKGGAGSIYDAYDKLQYASLERKLAADQKAWLHTEDLITALVANSKVPIPESVVEHLRRRLDGTAKKPRGRKKATDNTSILRNHLVPIYYERYLAWLQKRDRTQGLVGWSCIMSAPWWQGTPNERAARMVQAALKRHVDWRHVLNMVSKSRS